jgi:LPXTG-motif cell wall-anchored protein
LDTGQLLALVLVGLWLVIVAGVVLVLRRRRG